MADYGVEVFNSSGVLTYSSNWGCTRLLGVFVPNSESGSFTVPLPEDGQPIVSLFAYFWYGNASFDYLLDTNTRLVSYRSVWVEGNTIYWRDVKTSDWNSARIIYGDSYS